MNSFVVWIYAYAATGWRLRHERRGLENEICIQIWIHATDISFLFTIRGPDRKLQRQPTGPGCFTGRMGNQELPAINALDWVFGRGELKGGSERSKKRVFQFLINTAGNW
jgi:hypothetical protein